MFTAGSSPAANVRANSERKPSQSTRRWASNGSSTAEMPVMARRGRSRVTGSGVLTGHPVNRGVAVAGCAAAAGALLPGVVAPVVDGSVPVEVGAEVVDVEDEVGGGGGSTPV